MANETTELAAEVVRLSRSQTQNRVLILVLFLLFIGLLAFALFEQQKSQPDLGNVVSAQRFELVNQEGAKLGMLSTARSGPLFTLWQDKARVELRLGNHGPVFLLADAAGHPRATLTAREKATELQLVDEEGNIRASLTATKTTSELSLLDGKGKARIKMSAQDDGPRLEFFDTNGKLISNKP
jgi:hypothetical protein